MTIRGFSFGSVRGIGKSDTVLCRFSCRWSGGYPLRRDRIWLCGNCREQKQKTEKNASGNAGDDWFDIQYRQLESQPPPPSPLGPDVDALQIKVKEYLDGRVDETTGEVSRTQFSKIGRLGYFTLIIANVFAVILESIPEIDRAVGNSEGNLFDVFEAWSVLFFTIGK